MKEGRVYSEKQDIIFNRCKYYEYEIRQNIQYIADQKDITISHIFRELNANGVKLSREIFYKKPEEQTRGSFMSTLLLCNIADILGVHESLLMSRNIAEEYQRYITAG